MTVSIPDFKTDPFFNLEDKWTETASNEVTHYYDQGEGTPLLLLHGSGLGTSAAMTWWQNMSHLSQQYRTIAFDSIGYGETIAAADNTYGIKQWGEHTLRLMDALNIDKAWLVGSSLGGWVALQLAIDHPKRIHGVISVGTGGAKKSAVKPQMTQQNSVAESKNSAEPTASSPSTLSAEVIRKDLIKNIRNEALISDTLVQLRHQAAVKESAKGMRPLLQQARDRDRDQLPLDLSRLNQLQLPVLLVHGTQDKVVPLSRSLQLLQAIPSADLHVYGSAGHWPHIGRAEEFNLLVCDFIHQHS